MAGKKVSYPLASSLSVYELPFAFCIMCFIKHPVQSCFFTNDITEQNSKPLKLPRRLSHFHFCTVLFPLSRKLAAFNFFRHCDDHTRLSSFNTCFAGVINDYLYMQLQNANNSRFKRFFSLFLHPFFSHMRIWTTSSD